MTDFLLVSRVYRPLGKCAHTALRGQSAYCASRPWRTDATPTSILQKSRRYTPRSSAGQSLEVSAPSTGSRSKKGRSKELGPSGQDKGNKAQQDFPDETKPAADGFFHWKCHVCFERRKSETKDRFRHIKRRIAAPSTQRSLGRNFL